MGLRVQTKGTVWVSCSRVVVVAARGYEWRRGRALGADMPSWSHTVWLTVA